MGDMRSGRGRRTMTRAELIDLDNQLEKFENEYYPRRKIRAQGTAVYNAVCTVSYAIQSELDQMEQEEEK